MTHGEPQGDLPLIPEDDPDLAMVYADMHLWLMANPCLCDEDDGVCECLDSE